MTGNRNYGLYPDMVNWVSSNADRPITLNEAVEEYPSSTRGTVASCMNRIAKKFPEHFIQQGKGMYMWKSEATLDPGKVLGLVHVTDLDNEKVLVKDQVGNLFVLSPVTF